MFGIVESYNSETDDIRVWIDLQEIQDTLDFLFENTLPAQFEQITDILHKKESGKYVERVDDQTGNRILVCMKVMNGKNGFWKNNVDVLLQCNLKKGCTIVYTLNGQNENGSILYINITLINEPSPIKYAFNNAQEEKCSEVTQSKVKEILPWKINDYYTIRRKNLEISDRLDYLEEYIKLVEKTFKAHLKMVIAGLK